MARVLVLTDQDEQAFFERWDRGLSVWELRPLQIPSLDDLTFFEVIFIETDDLPLLTIIFKQLNSLPEALPTLACVSERNLGIVGTLKATDFMDRAASAIELNLRIDALVATASATQEITPPRALTKPLFQSEPTNRGTNYYRPNNQTANFSNSVIVDDLKFTKSGFGVLVGNTPIDLTFREFELFSFLVHHPNQLFTRDEVMSTVWGNEDMESSRVIDVHIRRIRSKLGTVYANYIKTIRSKGYLWATNHGENE